MITKSTQQPTPAQRLADFKAKAVYVPELNFVMGNQFYKQFRSAK